MKENLIFWGSKEFSTEKFKSVENNHWNKPKGGLWVSPVNSSFGWEDWCKSENFREEHFTDPDNYFLVKLSDNARVYTINTLEDLIKLNANFGENTDGRAFLTRLNFEKIAKKYDAIYLTEEGQWRTRLTEPNLYGWDCECVLILNKEVIEIPIEDKVKKNLEQFKEVCQQQQ